MSNIRITDLRPYSGGTRSDVLPIVNLLNNTTESITLQGLYDLYSAGTTTSFVFVMPKVSSGTITIPENSNAFLFGSEFDISNADVVVGSGSTLYVFDPSEYQLANNKFDNVPEYLDNNDAINNGLVVGKIYRTGDLLKIVHN
jgi:hypothetical protein